MIRGNDDTFPSSCIGFFLFRGGGGGERMPGGVLFQAKLSIFIFNLLYLTDLTCKMHLLIQSVFVRRKYVNLIHLQLIY